MSEFYVGYLPKTPPGVARRIKMTILALFVLAAAAAMGFAALQRTFAVSVFEFGKVQTFEGVIETTPYPMLLVLSPGEGTTPGSPYLLVGQGKHGADAQVAGYEGKLVLMRGTLIYRGEETAIELVSGSISMLRDASLPPPPTKDFGEFELIGEIVDSKCYLGVMNPGAGKVHRDCAVRCLQVRPIRFDSRRNGILAAGLRSHECLG